MKKCIMAVALILMLFLTGTLTAAADLWEPPEFFKVYSEDESMFFQFVPRDIKRIDSTRTMVSVYYNTEPPQLIHSWEFRDLAYENDFFFSKDLQHFAFIPQADFDIAVEFYSNGELVKTYSIRDLVRNYRRVFYTFSSAWWLKEGQDRPISQDGDMLTITTIDGLTYVFDINTGDIIERPQIFRPIILATVIGAGVIGGAVFLHIKRKSNS